MRDYLTADDFEGLSEDGLAVVIFINQLRSTISTGYAQGPTETTAGGRALKF